MQPHLILRVHADVRLGLGHVARAMAIHEAWRSLALSHGAGARCTMAISGDQRARRIGSGKHPFLEQDLACPVLDLGEDLHAPLPPGLGGSVVLLDQWDASPETIQSLRPAKVAVMEDDGESHEAADLLFQPFMEGVRWPDHPVRLVNGRKVRPFETQHGACRVLRGAGYITVSPAAMELRPRRYPLQPLASHRLLITFGGSDGPDLARRAFQVMQALQAGDGWRGTCTILAPSGLNLALFPGCTILERLPDLTRRIPEFDAVWCSAGITLAEALCMGVPAAAWGQNERQHQIISDLAHASGCLDLGIGPEADFQATEESLARWLGPEGQETRQEQSRDGMALVDGMGASRIAQELWALAAS